MFCPPTNLPPLPPPQCDDDGLDFLPPQELAALAQRISEIFHPLHRRAEHAQHAEERLPRRFDETPEPIVVGGLDAVQPGQIVQQSLIHLFHALNGVKFNLSLGDS